MLNLISESKRIVVKIGSALLVDNSTGVIHTEWFETLIQDLATLWRQGQQIVLVSSGAVALGRNRLQLMTQTLQLEQKQAAAAIGQIRLAHAYQQALAQYDISVAQVLLTLDDSENRRRYINAKNTLETLLKSKIIPVINENDTVATAEIRFGDNDRLAARVAQMISADTLVLLSDIDGLYTADPHKNVDATFIPEVNHITPSIEAMAGDSVSEYGSGGMKTKLAAAKIALASGCRMVIAAGKYAHPLQQIDSLQKNTWFIPHTTPSKARKNWIAHHLNPMGTLVIDEGAEKALHQGKSLLAAGVIAVIGEFNKGDAVIILNTNKHEIARGLINYPAGDAKKIMGHKSSEFEVVLDYSGYSEMIHRDDLVMHHEIKEQPQ